MIKILRDRTVLLTLAALALGDALQIRDGLYSPLAIALLGCSVVLAFAALVYESEPSKHADKILIAAVLIQLTFLLGDFPGSHHETHAWRDYWLFLGLIVLTIVVAGIYSRINHWHFAAGLAILYIFFGAGFWLLWKTPSPFMDVYVFQRDACDALMKGINPYTITYPDIYGSAGASVYGPGLSENGRLLFGFPYMPLTLFADLIGAGLQLPDYRLANLMAVAWAGMCIAAMNMKRTGVLAAAVFLYTPRGFFVIEQGWTEPLAIALLAQLVISVRRFPNHVPYLVGLLLASKQYMVLLIPLVPLLTDWRDWRFHLKALGTAVIVTLPLVLWDFRAFWDNAVMLQFRQPFRHDALSFAALLVDAGLPRPPTVVPLVAAIAVALICVRQLQRGAHGFALAFALTFLTFFALNRQAFANYYYLVIAALCCAIATAAQSGTPRRAASCS